MKLEMAASIQSQEQFSFEREAAWDSTADNQDVTSSLVSVNCEKLALSLQPIPVNEVLCLDKQWFDPATLEAIKTKSPSKPDERMRPIPPLPQEYELDYVRQYFDDQRLKKADDNFLISLNQKTSESNIPKQQEIIKVKMQSEESSESTGSDLPHSDHSKEANSESHNYEKTTQEVHDSLNMVKASPLQADVKEATTNQTSTSQTQELEDWLESVLN
jgi:hypothetical protein